MATKIALCLFVMTLAIYFLISSSHLHNTRIPSVTPEIQAIPPPKDTFQMIKEENSKDKGKMEVLDEEFIHGRMDFEITRDYYPGSGANNRHTPNPPVKD